jgi:hypothetical protein
MEIPLVVMKEHGVEDDERRNGMVGWLCRDPERQDRDVHVLRKGSGDELGGNIMGGWLLCRYGEVVSEMALGQRREVEMRLRW